MAFRKRTTSDATNLDLGAELPRASGIYAILSTAGSGKPGLYIGRASNLHARWVKHLSDFRNGTHNWRMMREYSEMGIDAFSVRVLELCEKSDCIKREEWWIARLFDGDLVDHYRRLNVSRNTDGPNPDTLGDALRRFYSDPKEREKQSVKLKRFLSDPESLRRRTESLRRFYDDPAECKKQSERNNLRFEDPAEHAKLSISAKRRYSDPMERAKSSDAQKLRFTDPAERMAMSSAANLRYEDQREREKLSESAKRRYEDPAEHEKTRDALKRFNQDHPEEAGKTSIAMKALWRNPAEREKIIGARKPGRDRAVAATRTKISAAIESIRNKHGHISFASVAKCAGVSIGTVRNYRELLEGPSVLRQDAGTSGAD